MHFFGINFFNGNHTPAHLLALNPVNSTFAIGVGGTLDNTGNTLMTQPGILQWQIGGGTISGGTISGSGFGSVYGSSTLNGVVLETDAFANASTLNLSNVPAFTGRTLTLRNKGAIVFSGTTPLADGNTITFASGSANLVATRL